MQNTLPARKKQELSAQFEQIRWQFHMDKCLYVFCVWVCAAPEAIWPQVKHQLAHLYEINIIVYHHAAPKEVWAMESIDVQTQFAEITATAHFSTITDDFTDQA